MTIQILPLEESSSGKSPSSCAASCARFKLHKRIQPKFVNSAFAGDGTWKHTGAASLSNATATTVSIIIIIVVINVILGYCWYQAALVAEQGYIVFDGSLEFLSFGDSMVFRFCFSGYCLCRIQPL